ncbi:hypothetical protein ACNKHS_23320 [Shigella flexneri]
MAFTPLRTAHDLQRNIEGEAERLHSTAASAESAFRAMLMVIA